MDVRDIILILFGIWLTAISVVFYLLLAHYRRLAKGSEKENLEKILGKILDKEEFNSKEIAKIWDRVGALEKDGSFHIQKVGLVKFNPFNETGGAQSFALAALDKHASGFLITGLHGRDRTRVYVKPVRESKSTVELSAEERKAISQASK